MTFYDRLGRLFRSGNSAPSVDASRSESAEAVGVPAGPPAVESAKHLRCSFCGKSKDFVDKFISGPGVYICNDCVDLCAEILAEQNGLVRPPASISPEDFQEAKPNTLRRFTLNELHAAIERAAQLGKIPGVPFGTIYDQSLVAAGMYRRNVNRRSQKANAPSSNSVEHKK